MAPRLTDAQRDELAEQALCMNVKGHNISHIAEELEVNWRTAKRLVKHALSKRDIDEDEEREKSLAHHRAIIEWCWEQLESPELAKNAQNRPAYVARAQASQSEIDRLNNVTPPQRHEWKGELTTRDESLNEYFAALDAFRENHGEPHTLESLDS